MNCKIYKHVVSLNVTSKARETALRRGIPGRGVYKAQRHLKERFTCPYVRVNSRGCQGTNFNMLLTVSLAILATLMSLVFVLCTLYTAVVLHSRWKYRKINGPPTER